MAQQNTYDLPVMVGAGVVGAITFGIFFFMRPDPVAPPPPTMPITTPVTAQAVTPVMVDTSGAPQGQQGGLAGGAPVAAGGGVPPGMRRQTPVAAGG